MDAGVKRDTKRKGAIAELRVAHDLVRAGFMVLVPYGENCRYDLAADNGERVYRVQVKTGRIRKGVMLFNAYSSHAHRGGPSCRGYSGQIDFFGVYCPENESTYIIPIGELPVLRGMLRIAPPLNNQSRKLRWANQYLLFEGLSSVGNDVPDAVATLALFEPP